MREQLQQMSSSFSDLTESEQEDGGSGGDAVAPESPRIPESPTQHCFCFPATDLRGGATPMASSALRSFFANHHHHPSDSSLPSTLPTNP
ncbi:hypothetical protein Fmac_007090 [Flemingia macrophylla]|uniref:Uncharacterized protein n=1 Tax=Flemingia macrophylla TaxID=520843 RepID=A0ABD1NCG3_9FABA